MNDKTQMICMAFLVGFLTLTVFILAILCFATVTLFGVLVGVVLLIETIICGYITLEFWDERN